MIIGFSKLFIKLTNDWLATSKSVCLLNANVSIHCKREQASLGSTKQRLVFSGKVNIKALGFGVSFNLSS